MSDRQNFKIAAIEYLKPASPGVSWVVTTDHKEQRLVNHSADLILEAAKTAGVQLVLWDKDEPSYVNPAHVAYFAPKFEPHERTSVTFASGFETKSPAGMGGDIATRLLTPRS